MKDFIYQAFAGLVFSSFPAFCAGASDDSPMDYFTEQDAVNAKANAPILASTTIKELIELGALPKQYAARFAEMSQEEQAELIDGVKQGVDSGRAVAEKIDGDRAVVLRESAYPGSWNKVVEMSRRDGAWIPGNETMMQSDSGASGSFFVTGVVSAQLSEGLIEHTDAYYVGDKDFPILLTISDILGPYLDGHEVPTVAFSHPGCLAVGSYSISHPRGRFSTGGKERHEVQTFDENISGTLDVIKIEDGRFWANFQLSANLRIEIGKAQDPAQTVDVKGTIGSASNLCPGGA